GGEAHRFTTFQSPSGPTACQSVRADSNTSTTRTSSGIGIPIAFSRSITRATAPSESRPRSARYAVGSSGPSRTGRYRRTNASNSGDHSNVDTYPPLPRTGRGSTRLRAADVLDDVLDGLQRHGLVLEIDRDTQRRLDRLDEPEIRQRTQPHLQE